MIENQEMEMNQEIEENQEKEMNLVIIDLYEDGFSYFCTLEDNITDLLVKMYLQSIYENLYKLSLRKTGIFSETLNRHITYSIRRIPYINY